MLAKLTSKNQLTLPKAILNQIDPADYFAISASEGCIVLTPVKVQKSDSVRSKLAQLGIQEKDIEDAISWVRSGVEA